MIQLFKLIREPSQNVVGGESFTPGKMYLDGVLFCQTCEDMDRKLEAGGVKIPKVTAIPRGRYRLVTSFSNHFQKVLPEVLDVKGYSGVRIHGGNKAEHSEGCILTGKVRTKTGIAQCQETVQRIIDTIDDSAELGIETWLEVV